MKEILFKDADGGTRELLAGGKGGGIRGGKTILVQEKFMAAKLFYEVPTMYHKRVTSVGVGAMRRLGCD
jgi:hypothetical protein